MTENGSRMATASTGFEEQPDRTATLPDDRGMNHSTSVAVAGEHPATAAVDNDDSSRREAEEEQSNAFGGSKPPPEGVRLSLFQRRRSTKDLPPHKSSIFFRSYRDQMPYRLRPSPQSTTWKNQPFNVGATRCCLITHFHRRVVKEGYRLEMDIHSNHLTAIRCLHKI